MFNEVNLNNFLEPAAQLVFNSVGPSVCEHIA